MLFDYMFAQQHFLQTGKNCCHEGKSSRLVFQRLVIPAGLLKVSAASTKRSLSSLAQAVRFRGSAVSASLTLFLSTRSGPG